MTAKGVDTGDMKPSKRGSHSTTGKTDINNCNKVLLVNNLKMYKFIQTS